MKKFDAEGGKRSGGRNRENEVKESRENRPTTASGGRLRVALLGSALLKRKSLGGMAGSCFQQA
jgi:hypothetical protein